MKEPSLPPTKPLPLSQRPLSAPQAVGAVVALILAVVVLRKCVGADDEHATMGGSGQTASALPWLGTVRSSCAAYKAAPNDIKRSAIFNDTMTLLGAASITGARGKLTRLQTNQGGSEVALAVEVEGAVFANESLLAPIDRGSAVYAAASNMRVGQCVIFSADKIRPSSLVEQSKVCDTDYFASLTSLGPCQ